VLAYGCQNFQRSPIRDLRWLRTRFTSRVRIRTSASRDEQIALTSWLTAVGMCTEGRLMRHEASLARRGGWAGPLHAERQRDEHVRSKRTDAAAGRDCALSSDPIPATVADQLRQLGLVDTATELNDFVARAVLSARTCCTVGR